MKNGFSKKLVVGNCYLKTLMIYYIFKSLQPFFLSRKCQLRHGWQSEASWYFSISITLCNLFNFNLIFMSLIILFQINLLIFNLIVLIYFKYLFVFNFYCEKSWQTCRQKSLEIPIWRIYKTITCFLRWLFLLYYFLGFI